MKLFFGKKTNRIINRNNGDFYCLNCRHFYRIKIKPKSHKKIRENKLFCNIVMPSEDTKILEFNQYQKSNEAPFIIYADLECLIEKFDGCKNKPENSYTRKVGECILSGSSVSTISSFKSIENKHVVCRVKYCMKKFCKPLREHVLDIITFKKKKMKLLTNEQQKSYQNVNMCYISKKNFENKHAKDKKCRKIRDYCHYTGEYGGAAHRICNLVYLKKFL